MMQTMKVLSKILQLVYTFYTLYFHNGTVYTRGVTKYRATIYHNTKMQQYVSWIVPPK